MQEKKRKFITVVKMSPELSSFLVFLADSGGNHQLKSELNAGCESNLRSSCIPRPKCFSPGAKRNTVRGGRFSLFNINFP